MRQAGAFESIECLSALVFLGYPLHPPGRPDRLRAAHLRNVDVPMLFVQGSRDPFGSPEELCPIIEPLKPRAELLVVEGGDHSFKAPKKFGMDQPQIYEAAMDEIVNWTTTI